MKTVTIALPIDSPMFSYISRTIVHEIEYLHYSIEVEKGLTSANRQKIENKIELLEHYLVVNQQIIEQTKGE